MKFNLNQKEEKMLLRLIDQKYLNIATSDFYNAYLEDRYNSIDKRTIHELEKQSGMKEEEAFYHALLLLEDLSPEDGDVKLLEEKNRIENVQRLHEAPYEKLSFTEVRIPEKKCGDWELKYNYFAPYEGFFYDDVYADPEKDYAERNSLGFFTREVKYLTILEKNRVWMSLTPHEINTMKKPLSLAHGNVLVYGLGLGYFALMAAKKSEVSAVTVVENDKEAISLFANEIKPRSRFGKKVSVIQDDAFAYQKSHSGFDFSFFDIYHDPEDGLLPYLKMKALEKNSPKTEYTYWIEASLLALLRRYLLTLAEESLNGLSDEDYQDADNDEDKLLNLLYFRTKDMVFSSFEGFKSFLLDDTLRAFSQTVLA